MASPTADPQMPPSSPANGTPQAVGPAGADGGAAAGQATSPAADPAFRAAAGQPTDPAREANSFLRRSLSSRYLGSGGRIGGLDLARGLAVLGMIGAHTLSREISSPWVVGLHLVHGRSAALFALLAGVSLGILSGADRPHTGQRLLESRMRIVARALCLAAISGLLVLLPQRAMVILGAYAGWFLLSIPVLRLSARYFFALAGGFALLGPSLRFGLQLLPELGLSIRGDAGILWEYFVFSNYPAALWLAYVFLGLGLARVGLQHRRTLIAMAVGGAVLMGVGYGGGQALSAVATPATYQPYTWVSESVATWAVGEPPGMPGGRGDNPSAQQTFPNPARNADAPSAAPPSKDPVTLDPRNPTPPGDTLPSDAPLTDAPVEPAESFPLTWTDYISGALADPTPHADTSAAVLGTGGFALLVLSGCLALRGRLARLFSPINALGSLALTGYVYHLFLLPLAGLVLAMGVLQYALVAGLTLILAMMIRAVFPRGPLEWLLFAASYRLAGLTRPA